MQRFSIAIFLTIAISFFLFLSCTPKKVTDALVVEKTIQQDSSLSNELIIQFKEVVDVENWVLSYKKYGLALKKPLSKAAKIYLFVFDNTIVTKEQALKLFDKDKAVKAVELNKKIQAR